MTTDVLTLPSTVSVRAASRLMLLDNLHAVPVTSETGQLVGMFSATDVMAWVAGVQLR